MSIFKRKYKRMIQSTPEFNVKYDLGEGYTYYIEPNLHVGGTVMVYRGYQLAGTESLYGRGTWALRKAPRLARKVKDWHMKYYG